MRTQLYIVSTEGWRYTRLALARTSTEAIQRVQRDCPLPVVLVGECVGNWKTRNAAETALADAGLRAAPGSDWWDCPGPEVAKTLRERAGVLVKRAPSYGDQPPEDALTMEDLAAAGVDTSRPITREALEAAGIDPSLIPD